MRVRAPLILSWDAIGCQYSTPRGLKTVLEDVSGVARPYELLALMGPSGAGKSTLLDILAARKTVGRLAGGVSVNGAPRGPGFVRLISYVPQEDNFTPALTVKETCELHGALLLPRGTPREQAAVRIDEVLCSMGMLHTRDTLVGGLLPGGLALRGLSGGERRRLSVAVGILAAPSIVFLDEPTSGLDSCSALAVVEHLRDRARDAGLTVVASIHQPRSAVWACFDACAVLSGGMSLYHGRCDQIVAWFQDGLGYGPWESTVHGTASDWVMDLVNVGFTKGEFTGFTIATRKDLEQAARKFSRHYHRTVQQQQIHDEMQKKNLAKQQLLAKQQREQQCQPSDGSEEHQERGLLQAWHSASSAGEASSFSQAGAGAAQRAPRPQEQSAAALCPRGPGSSGGGAPRRSQPGAAGEPEDPAALLSGAGTRPGQACAGARMFARRQQQHQAKEQGRPLVVVDAVDLRDGSLTGSHSGRGSHSGSDSPASTLRRRSGQSVTASDGFNGSGSASHGGAGGAGLGCAAAELVQKDVLRATWWKQFRALLRRELLTTMRNPADVAGRMLLFTWVGFFCGLVFWRLGDGVDALRNRVNLLFIALQQFMLLPYVYMSLYASDRKHFTADIGARLYSPGPYYAAKTLGVLPFALANVLLCTFIIYGMAGLRLDAGAIAVNGASSVLLYLIAQQVQALAAILMPNEDGSFLLTIAWTALNLYLSNFIIRFQDMANVWLTNLRYFSAISYAYSAVLRAEFSGASLGCGGGLAPDLVAGMQSLLPATPQVRSQAMIKMATSPGDHCVMHLDAVVSYFGVGALAWSHVGALGLYLGVMHILTYASLLLLARKEQR